MTIEPGATIGIIGGGQLGKMIAMAASTLGYKTHVFTNEQNSPASQIASSTTVASFNNKEALIKFAESVNVATIEFENIPYNTIEVLEKYVNVFPGSKILYITQNRLLEKSFVKNLSIPVVEYYPVNSYNDLLDGIEQIKYPALLKTVKFGYDGKGQYLIRSEDDLQKMQSLDWNISYILESFVNVIKEVSIIIARDMNKNCVMFPIAENIHKDGILDTSEVPAQINDLIVKQAQDIAQKIALSLDLIGILAIEFFVDNEFNLIVNEMAPRPHNSGHWSIDACNVSQFEQLVRTICNLPLQEVKLLFPCVTKNLIGEEILDYMQYLHNPNASLAIYGKDKIKKHRKMGHVNIKKS